MQHKHLTPDKWTGKSIDFQIGNIGAEAARALHWKAKGRGEQAEKSLERALELLDLTVASVQSSSARKELLRLREVLCDTLQPRSQYHSQRQLENYFLAFAVAARNQR